MSSSTSTTPGALYTPQVLPGQQVEFDPAGVRSQFAAAAAGSLANSMTPGRATMGSDIWRDIGGQGLAAENEATSSTYNSIFGNIANTLEANNIKVKNGKYIDYGNRHLPSFGNTSQTPEEAWAPGGLAYNAFRDVVAKMSADGLDKVEVSALAEFAKNNGVTMAGLIDGINELSDDAKLLAKAELKHGGVVKTEPFAGGGAKCEFAGGEAAEIIPEP